ncbi:hypothetical protein BDA99DRAFT_538788 [Phascolomyces articulosus]|uniref:Uncharacterized protein n=1 Tax=Phascolomyces articulosus TaxID=60185 RepID=A0AAD5JX73_9FUNG|nr:hypothetical protein BDA99DRAFT_538788 [Phascolomyces articulosus]
MPATAEKINNDNVYGWNTLMMTGSSDKKLVICIKKEKEPKIIQSKLAKWAKDEFKLEKVPGQQTISDILKKKMNLWAGQSTILILKSFETYTSRAAKYLDQSTGYWVNESPKMKAIEEVNYAKDINQLMITASGVDFISEKSLLSNLVFEKPDCASQMLYYDKYSYPCKNRDTNISNSYSSVIFEVILMTGELKRSVVIEYQL